MVGGNSNWGNDLAIGGFIGQPMLGASIGGSIAGAAGSLATQAVLNFVGAVAGGATQFVGDAVQITTGDGGAAAATAGGFATASEGA